MGTHRNAKKQILPAAAFRRNQKPIEPLPGARLYVDSWAGAGHGLQRRADAIQDTFEGKTWARTCKTQTHD